jgi:imidazolonepropionase-like amidohydrolase
MSKHETSTTENVLMGKIPQKAMFSYFRINSGILNVNFKDNVMKTALCFALMMLVGSMSALAQTPAPRQSQPVALVGGTIHTLAGEVVENGTILFEDGVITAIGTDVQLPAGTLTEDVSGRHVYPGLIDGWTNMGIYEIGAVDMTVDSNEQGPINPNVMVERAFHPESRHIAVARSAGILTSVTSPGGGLISGQSAAMALDGWAWDEMTVRARVAMMVNWPNPNNARTYASQVGELRNAFNDARSYKKAVDAYEAGSAVRPGFDSRWHAMMRLFDGDQPVIISANEVRAMQDAITWAQEENIRIIILGGRDAHLITDHLRETNTPVLVSTVQSSPARWWEPYYAWYELPRQLHEAGVTFAIVGSSGAPNANRLPFEAGTAAAFGLPLDEALKSLTVYPAQILGLDDRLGTLEPGKDASLIITDGNPIEYATQVVQVYVRGRKSDMMDAHKELYERYLQKVLEAQAE